MTSCNVQIMVPLWPPFMSQRRNFEAEMKFSTETSILKSKDPP